MPSRLCYNYGEMKERKTTGFTIIETMLFLAISGFLFVAILASTGNTINNQRYHDTVYSLQSFIQKQYSEIINVSNESSKSNCSAASEVLRGQSECVILGRYISTANDGASLKVYKVIGIEKSTATSGNDDIKIFSEQYDLEIYKLLDGQLDVEEYDLEWGAKLVNDASSEQGPSHFSILLLRSPESGIVRTFTDPSNESFNNEKINSIIADESRAYLENNITACVDSNGLLSEPKSAIFIHANAAVQSDIEVIGDKDSNCR